MQKRKRPPPTTSRFTWIQTRELVVSTPYGEEIGRLKLEEKDISDVANMIERLALRPYRQGRRPSPFSQAIASFIADHPRATSREVFLALRGRAEQGDPVILAAGRYRQPRGGFLPAVGLDRVRHVARPLPDDAVVWRQPDGQLVTVLFHQLSDLVKERRPR